MNIELSILDWIQTLHTPFLDKIMVFITRLGDAGIIWIVLSIVLLLIPKTRKSGAVMVAALVVDVLLCNIVLKNLVARTRPYDVNTGVHLLVAKLHDYSFPSGHTAASFAASSPWISTPASRACCSISSLLTRPFPTVRATSRSTATPAASLFAASL